LKGEVSYRGYVLNKEDLINMRAILLDKSLELMKKCSFFRQIPPKKIFTDMFTFFNETQRKLEEPLEHSAESHRQTT